ncbi:hypothetical protein HYH02_010120 [Chlamydomonas schloesseri]|uniref:Uncharacterized protein n=1 Tax=Chlamydomonas schloesseri TaxID=2026947 RepID=A0A835W9E1_9CHLO|nr:hypothetical protein HYH02_010120 [Chlamydomonas schloesseri]|eukprot:KAG2441281.1 hypothetical protein HYH02_010120 [Chlamydomonas schloesseri]
MYMIFAPMLGIEVALCLLQVARHYAGEQYLGCFKCISLLEAAGAACVAFQWLVLGCIATASLFMLVEQGPGPLFLFQVLFFLGSWALVIIAAYLSGLYLGQVCRGRSTTSGSYSQLHQTDARQQAYSHVPPAVTPHPLPHHQPPSSYQPHAAAAAQASQYVPPTAL